MGWLKEKSTKHDPYYQNHEARAEQAMQQVGSKLVWGQVFVLIFPLYLPLHSMAEEDADLWIADKSAQELENPINANRRSQRRVERSFQQRCTVCHGDGGTGNGPESRALSPKPANLTEAIYQSQTDGELFWKISLGRGAMPGWELILDIDDRWDLVNFLRTLAEK